MGPFEDVVTLAVNAAMPMLTAADREAIRLLIVATESSPDQEKPVSSWVHHFLGLRSDCRNFEVKHACYGATGALQVAIGWLMSAADPGAKALIINADHALIGLDGPQEPVLGAGGPGAARLQPAAHCRIRRRVERRLRARSRRHLPSSSGRRDRRRRREPAVVSRCGGAHLRRVCRAGRAGRRLRSVLRRQRLSRAVRRSRPARAFSARATRAGLVEGRGRVSLGQEVQGRR